MLLQTVPVERTIEHDILGKVRGTKDQPTLTGKSCFVFSFVSHKSRPKAAPRNSGLLENKASENLLRNGKRRSKKNVTFPPSQVEYSTRTHHNNDNLCYVIGVRVVGPHERLARCSQEGGNPG